MSRVTGFRFTGTERVTFELDGTFDATRVRLPAGLAHDGGRVSLFAFHVERLRIRGVPLLGWSYPELLWRVAVIRDGVPSWWVVACDLAARGPRWAARRYVRYDVRPHRVVVEPSRIESRGPAGELAIAVGAPAGDAVADTRRVLRVGSDASWVVPWGEEDGPRTAHRVTIEHDSLSGPSLGAPVDWADRAVLQQGRLHRCGVAHR